MRQQRPTMQTSAILAADPNALVNRHEAMRLLGITRIPVWRELVRSGELAIFQEAAGPNPPTVEMRSLQDYVRRLSARAEEQRRKRFRAAYRGRTPA